MSGSEQAPPERSGVDVSTLVPHRTFVEDNRRWAGFEHRPDDVFVCTPPKCGTTWTQTIVTILIHGGDLPAPVLVLSPWLEMRQFPIEGVLAQLEAQEHRRCIKSHSPADALPWFDGPRYLVVGRDGRDAAMSFLNHSRAMREDVVLAGLRSAEQEGIEVGAGRPPVEDVHEYFAWWLEHGPWFRHLASFWERRERDDVLFVHFNDLKADLDGQMRRIARFLDVAVDEARWPALVERCTFASMKAHADDIAPFDVVFEGGADAFLYKGTNDRWRDVLTAEEVAAFEAALDERLPADAAAWTRGEHVAGVSD